MNESSRRGGPHVKIPSTAAAGEYNQVLFLIEPALDRRTATVPAHHTSHNPHPRVFKRSHFQQGRDSLRVIRVCHELGIKDRGGLLRS